MNRKQIFAGAVAAFLILSNGAQAHDWSGPELGIQGGFGFAGTSGDLAHPGSVPYRYSADGPLGGGHAGYNWQIGPWVFGLEGDAEVAHLAGFQDPASHVAVDSRMNFDGSVRGKLGFGLDRLLLYGTGGAAFGNITTRYSVGGLTWFPAESLRAGWTIGTGIDYALSGHWDAGIEYRYTSFGSHGVSNAIFADTNRVNFNAIRLSITYRFPVP